MWCKEINYYIIMEEEVWPCVSSLYDHTTKDQYFIWPRILTYYGFSLQHRKQEGRINFTSGLTLPFHHDYIHTYNIIVSVSLPD